MMLTDKNGEPVEVTQEADRFSIAVDGKPVGLTAFVEHGEQRVFYHTEIDPAFGGRGLGTTLVGEAMADEARRGNTVIPVCPFVIKYLKSHDVPGLKIEWRPRDVEVAESAPTDEKQPGDEGVGDGRG